MLHAISSLILLILLVSKCLINGQDMMTFKVPITQILNTCIWSQFPVSAWKDISIWHTSRLEIHAATCSAIFRNKIRID